MSLLERTFQIEERGSTVRTEILAGVTTFLTMAYIVFVNPAILSETGMPVPAVAAATCLSAAIGCILMGLLSNYPIALAPGMGLNAYFAFTVVKEMGVPWQTALGCVFLSGCAFLVLTAAGVRQLIVNAIPRELFSAVAAGVGLFVAFVGLRVPKGADGDGQFSVNGARADNMSFLVDGMNNTQRRNTTVMVSPPLEGIQEFKLITSGVSAEYGRFSGGMLSMVTKSGGNRLRGSVYEFLRNDALDARNFFDVGKSKLIQNQFGATASGPLWLPRLYHGRNRTFFLVSWESQRQISGTRNVA